MNNLNTKIVIIFILQIYTCGRDKGQFMWAANNPSMQGIIEKNISHIRNFQFVPDVPKFFNDQQIWWIYQFASSPSSKKLAISVALKNFGWVEVIHKNLNYLPDDNVIRDSLVIKKPGCYMINISVQDGLLDQHPFEVASRQILNFNKKFDSNDNTLDEIINYSKDLSRSIPCP